MTKFINIADDGFEPIYIDAESINYFTTYTGLGDDKPQIRIIRNDIFDMRTELHLDCEKSGVTPEKLAEKLNKAGHQIIGFEETLGLNETLRVENHYVSPKAIIFFQTNPNDHYDDKVSLQLGIKGLEINGFVAVDNDKTTELRKAMGSPRSNIISISSNIAITGLAEGSDFYYDANEIIFVTKDMKNNVEILFKNGGRVGLTNKTLLEERTSQDGWEPAGGKQLVDLSRLIGFHSGLVEIKTIKSELSPPNYFDKQSRAYHIRAENIARIELEDNLTGDPETTAYYLKVHLTKDTPTMRDYFDIAYSSKEARDEALKQLCENPIPKAPKPRARADQRGQKKPRP